MGPWFIRDEANPFLPGCSLATLQSLIRRGRVLRDTIIRGPSTRQFWTFARNVPGIANLLGECHACHQPAAADDAQCRSCGASFAVLDDRERLGLSDVRLLPGHAAPEQIAAATDRSTQTSPTPGANQPVEVPQPALLSEEAQELAHSLMAARQRKRRSQRRTTIAVALISVALLAAAGIAAMVLLDQQSNPPTAPPASPTAPTPRGTMQGETMPSTDTRLAPKPSAPAPATEPKPANDEMGMLLFDLSSPSVEDAKQAARETPEKTYSDKRVRRAIEAAAMRERISQFSKRL